MNNKVLIVDDARGVVESLAAIFSQRGYLTKSARSAEDALRLIVQWAPDFAVLDVMLPGMDGINLAIALKEICPNCKVLLFSGCAETEDLLVQANSNGHYFEILAKPVNPRFLLEAAARMLAS
jgi:DNA-binding NtrC family response regulator